MTLNQHDNRGNILLLSMILLFLLLMAFGCRTVSKISSSEKRESVSVVDSVHVKKYDTSVTTHEVTEYQTKIIELYDTVITQKDSFVVYLKTRTIWTNGKQEKTETKAGTGSDSAIRKSQTSDQSVKTNKTVERYFDWGNMLFPLMAVGIGCLIVWYGFKWLKKQYE